MDTSNNSIRPTGLSLLCILSFIGSGCYVFSYFVMASALPTFKDLFLYDDTYAALYDSVPMMRDAMEQILNLGPVFFWVNALLYAVSLAGAILMYKRKFKGFHIYTIAQCLLILWSMYKFGWGVPWGSIFLSGCFVAMYALYIPYLKNLPLKAPYNPNDSNNSNDPSGPSESSDQNDLNNQN